MACQDCDISESTFTFTPEGEGAIVIGPFATEGDGISFGEVADERDAKVDSDGNFLLSGSRIKQGDVTLRVPCSEASVLLWSQWKRNTISFCGSANYIDNCCTGETWDSARITSVKRPSGGDSVSYYEIVMQGVYIPV